MNYLFPSYVARGGVGGGGETLTEFLVVISPLSRDRSRPDRKRGLVNLFNNSTVPKHNNWCSSWRS